MLALLVQMGLLLLILQSTQRSAPLHKVVHETILLLHRPSDVSRYTAHSSPVTSEAPTTPSPIVRPIGTTGSIIVPPIAPSDLQNLGRQLFGCAPEDYANLPPSTRAICPKPAEGMVINREPDLLKQPPSGAKDEVYWQEQWRRSHFVYGNCNSVVSGTPTVACLLEQRRAEMRREHSADDAIARSRAAQFEQPKRPTPNIGNTSRPLPANTDISTGEDRQ